MKGWRSMVAAAAMLALGVAAAAASPRGMLADEPMWDAYKARFVLPSGRTVDTANGGITHSEGQGYAMLLALAADDPATFARLEAFTRVEMALRDDGLIAWRWEEGRGVTDLNNATDGDMLIAWALHEAHLAGWGEDYGRRARALVEAIAPVLPDHAGRPVIAPGRDGFDADERGGRLVNLSYWVFPALESLASLDPSYDALAESGRDLLDRAIADGVPTDWTRLDADGVPRPAPDPGGAEAALAYNAVRLPLYLAWSRDGHGPLLKALAGTWPQGEPATVPASGGPGEPMGGHGYRAVAALSECARSGTRFPDALRSGLDAHYYPASLHLLSVLALKERYPRCW